MSENAPLPWEQQDGETTAAFAAFCCFRDLGAARSLRTAYRKFCARKRGVRSVPRGAPGAWTAWSTAHDWVSRARAWDGHCDALARAEIEKRIRELAERRAEAEAEHHDRLTRRGANIDAALGKLDTPKKKGDRTWQMLDAGYARLARLQLMMGRELVNGPRRPEKGKPPEKESAPLDAEFLNGFTDDERADILRVAELIRRRRERGTNSASDLRPAKT